MVTVHQPGAAYDAFLRAAGPASAAQPRWTPADGPLPSIYLSHGAPPLFDDAVFLRELGDWALRMPKPRAILIVSAHWEHAPLSLSSAAAAPTPVYDFGGFARRFFTMRYDTPDAHDLAARVAALVPDGTDLHEHRSRGLDHGAWVPLKVMYPHADVPTLQLSLPTADPGALLALGARLRPLREEGVLVIGSGFLTHGLPFVTSAMVTRNEAPGWSAEFDAWAADALARGAVDELAAYADRAPGMPYAHPTVEHFLPLFVTLGAAADPAAAATTQIEGYMWGLSKRSFSLA
ncbi:dioxygenase [Pilimelia terevasa]|uniref:Dioxygenase n=1 Tax=Pilimelia terevasa TaxID=53372 RepID=A0A8J3FEF0_9ACTN|nr:class III extradiol ring-cleavage dioxygenase [Pilimelia terevasa]GGK16550.1 dioxygenase [Pilimelia terevasa]